MNKIYSKVWNKALGQLVVASEFASSGSSGSSGSTGSARASGLAALTVMSLAAAIAMSSPASAQVFINDGTDGSCAVITDTPTNQYSGSVPDANCNTNFATQTDHTTFFGPTGNAGTGSNNLSLGGYLLVNTTGSSINGLALRSQKLTLLGNGVVSATSTDGVNGSELYSTGNGLLGALGGTGGAISANGAITAPSYVLSTGTATSVGGALTNIDTLGTKYFRANSTGTAASATGTNGIAIGNAATATGVGTISFGTGSSAAATGALSFGNGAKSFTDGDLAIGNNTSASGGGLGSVVIGTGAKALTSAVVIGNGAIAQSPGGTPVAIGFSAKAVSTSGSGIAIGDWSRAQGAGAVAIGGQPAGNYTAGQSTLADGDRSVALGNTSQTSAADSVAVGSGAKTSAAATKSVALGSGATASTARSVALGDGSTTAAAVANTSTVINGVTYANAGATGATAPVGVVSVGTAGAATRQIQNVSAGQVMASSTDAVNGSQLFATNQAVGALAGNAVQYDNTAKTGVTLGGVASTDGGLTNGTKISNVAQGNVAAGSTDAVNGTQLNTTNTNIANVGATAASLAGSLGGGASYNPTTNTYTAPSYTTSNANGSTSTVSNVGAALAAINSQGIKYFHANSTAADSQALGLNSVAIGPNAKTTGDTAVALGNGSTADMWGIAIGGGQALTNTGGLGAGSIALGMRSLAQGDGSSNGDTDGTQGAAALAIGIDSKATADGSIAVGEGSSATQYFATTVGEYANATGSLSTAVGGKSSATAASSSAIGAGASASATNAVALGAASVADVANTVSVGSAGAERKIVNVAAGEVSANSTDAVNGSQLDATNTNVGNVGNAAASLAGSLGGGASYDATTNTYVAPTYTTANANGTSSTVDNVGDALTSINSQGIKYFHANSTLADAQATGTNAVAVGPDARASGFDSVAVGEGARSGNNFTVAVGHSANASGQNAIAFGVNSVASGGMSIASGNAAKATGLSSAAYGDGAVAAFNQSTAIGGASATGAQGATAVGDGAKALAAGSVALGYNSVANVADTVSVGSVGAERKLVNVAAAQLSATSTDAVNGSQLYATNQAVDAVAVTANNSVQYDDAAKTSVTLGGTASTDGGLTNGTRITNVAQGDLSDGSTDAVNGTQLHATNQSVADLTDTVVANKTHYYSVNDNGVQGGNYDNEGATGLNSMAAGINAAASGNRSTALGTASVANATGATAVGADSSARGNNSTAMGRSTSISAANGVAAGYTAFVSGISGVAVGTHAGAVSQDAIAIGTNAVGGARSSVALGANASATAVNSVALGAGSTATGSTLGNPAWQPQDASGAAIAVAGTAPVGEVSVGSAGNERRLTNVAAGSETTDAVNVSQLQAVDGKLDSLSNNAVQYDDAAKTSVTLGGVASTDGGLTDGTRITNVAQGDVSDGSTDAVNGTQLNTTNTNVAANATNIANVGGAVTSVAGSLGGGASYDPTTNTYTAPSYTTANADGSTSTVDNVGDAIDAINSQGIRYFHANSTGADSQALGVGSVAIGSAAVANNADDVALGSNSSTTATTATSGTVIDGNTYAFAGSSPTAALGVGGRQIQNVAAGQLDAGSTDAVNGSQLYATNQAVEATAAIANNSVQYDDASKASVTLAGPVSTDGGVTGGTRITNVAQGDVSDGSTDAVNGTQLNTTNTNVATNATNIANVGGAVASVADGLGGGASYDPATNTYTAPSYTTANADGSTSTVDNVGDAIDAINSQGIRYFHANSTAADSQALGLDSVAIGGGAVATNAADVALGSHSTTMATTATASAVIDGTTYAFAGATPTAALGVGGRQIQNVAAGQLDAGSTDAVNGSQLYATNQAVEATAAIANNSVQYDDASKAVVTLAGPVSTDGGVTGGTRISNVAQGDVSDGSTDAVNGTQLNQTNQNVTANTTAIGALDGRVTTIEGTMTSIGHGSVGMFQVSQDHNTPPPSATGADSAAGGSNATASGDSSVAIGNSSTASGSHSSALGNGATASGSGSTAVGQGATASADGSVALGSGSSDGGRGVESYVGKYSGAQNDTAGTVSVGNAASGETRTVSNVADGQQATDAVNVRQLDGAVQVAKDYTDTQISNVNSSVGTLGTQVANNSADIANIQKGSDGMFQVSADANGSKPTASGTKSVAAGNNAVATGSNTTAVGDDATASGEASTALGNGAQATGDNSVAIGAGSVATRDNAVSVGSAGNERQVTNVAAGTENTDAVNVSQLKATQASGVQYDKNADGSNDYSNVTMDPGGDPTVIHNVGAGTADTDVANVGQLNAGVDKAIDWSKNYTDQRFNSLDHKVNTIGNRANGGIASAMAMASLPQAYQPNQSSAAVALGNFHGETGIAVGVSTITESGHYVFKLNATTNTRGDAGVGVGAGVVW